MFIQDKRDKLEVIAYFGEKNGTTFAAKRKSDLKWLWKRIRCYTPENILYQVVKELFDCWGSVVCTVTKQPQFSEESSKKARGTLHDIQKG